VTVEENTTKDGLLREDASIAEFGEFDDEKAKAWRK